MFECLWTIIDVSELARKDWFQSEFALVEASRLIKEQLVSSVILCKAETS